MVIFFVTRVERGMSLLIHLSNVFITVPYLIRYYLKNKKLCERKRPWFKVALINYNLT